MEYRSLIPPEYSGVVSVKRAGETLVEAAFGDADAPNARPNRLDTRFVTASAGKAFTAACVLRQIEAGRISLDSTIGELLRDISWNRIDPGITVRQLLTHTSGIPDYCDEQLVPNYADLFIDLPNYRIRTNRDLLPLFIGEPMTDPAGTRFHYNNTGFVVLGMILEAVCGKPFDQAVRDELFTPCHMADSGYFEYDRLPANCATVYIHDPDRGEDYTNIYSSTAKGVGDGGAFVTLGDVERFWRGLYGGQVLGPHWREQMTAPQAPGGTYGYGLWLEQLEGTWVPHFEGCEPGISFLSTYDPSRDLLLTFISNRGDDVWRLNRAFLRQLYQGVTDAFDFGE